MSCEKQEHIGATLGKPSAEDFAVLKAAGRIKVAGALVGMDLSNVATPLFAKFKASTKE